jgi:hypothetical protein
MPGSGGEPSFANITGSDQIAPILAIRGFAIEPPESTEAV